MDRYMSQRRQVTRAARTTRLAAWYVISETVAVKVEQFSAESADPHIGHGTTRFSLTRRVIQHADAEPSQEMR